MIKLSFGLIVLLSFCGDDSTEVALRLACVVKLGVDDFILSNVEVTWKGDFKVAIVLFSDVELAVIICFWSEVAKTERATNMITPIMMKATKNINKAIKTHFWDAMLLNECQLVRPHNFLAWQTQNQYAWVLILSLSGLGNQIHSTISNL